MGIRLNQVAQQQFSLTPGLKLSLEVLQLPLLQLQTYLEQQLEDNPVLEVREQIQPIEQQYVTGDQTRSLADRIANGTDQGADAWSRRDSHSSNAEEDDAFRPDSLTKPPSLHEHLLFQLRCLPLGPEIAQAAETLLEWLESDGYLRHALEEIARTEGCTVANLEQGLAAIQQLDPPGIGARTLPECLLLQLRHRHDEHSVAVRILQEHFDLLAARNMKALAARLRVSVERVQEACRLIVQLDPKPARNFSDPQDATPLVPDLIVSQVQGEYYVELNNRHLPSLMLSQRYRSLLRRPDTPGDAKQFIRQKIRHAVWVLKAIQQRHDTLLTIAQRLVELERDYLTHGITHLTPLTQDELAQHIGCHASTISRAIAGKTMQTPCGIVPLQLFFGGSINRTSGTTVKISARTVQAEIAHLLATEDPNRPLSDQAIADSLRARGFAIARRTVAKYRSALRRLPAHFRKRGF